VAATARIALPYAAQAQRLVVVVRTSSPEACVPIIDVLVEAGIRAIELTLTTPGALDVLSTARARHSDRVDLGMGTVLSGEDARLSLAAGAQFLVTPGVVLDAITLARASGVAAVCGALTPTEVMTAWSAGASAIKLFPASLLSTSYLRELRGPFPDLVAIPSGGLGVDDIRPWLDAGCAVVSLGGAVTSGSLDHIARTATEAIRVATSGPARPPR